MAQKYRKTKKGSVPGYRDPGTDPFFMRLAIEEALKGSGQTAPNPCVGAVIVREGRVLSYGYHHAAGKPHAEVEALHNLASPQEARGATLYVTLEPCSTTGKTPPCTKALMEAGFARVVYGATDPNPHHRGQAAEILTAAGIEVTTSILEKECSELNRHWNYRMQTGLPWVIAKCGMSLDGRISSFPGRRWITSPTSRRDAMRLRARVEAILVGGETIRIDDPALTVRLHKRGQSRDPGIPGLTPFRVVWSRSGNIPKDAHVLTDGHRARTLIFSSVSLKEALRELGGRGISSVLIEGGGYTLGEAFDQNLVNEVRFYIAPLLLGGPTAALGGKGKNIFTSLKKVSYRIIGGDVVISGMVER
ncbi:MAG: bifunctional diaminohydroxyphosphoribosylaminopyrimidine deaminase/5-amino-6-(5-phosphoribosylamino)uracil reductase RibD [Chthoniobacterales bacterium]|nr:bifunctional diaminohydroxyphosphoribosylaminopyrimidine deaminase/5-amino-6-(5-phosphoribosylamino)uracil reductase RibD [Chthoniobacterales bacterium]